MNKERKRREQRRTRMSASSSPDSKTTPPVIYYSPESCAHERESIFNKSIRINQVFERYLLTCQSAETATAVSSSSSSCLFPILEPTLLDATQNKEVPLTYFTSSALSQSLSSPSSSPQRKSNRQSGKADTMQIESFRILNLQKPGKNAHALILIKSKAITANASNIGIFEPNGQKSHRELTVIDHSEQQPEERDVTRKYLSLSPKHCINYGNTKHNPGYCGIFGIICVVMFRHYNNGSSSSSPQRWLKKWETLLEYMKQEIPDEPESHGCLGVNLAAKVQEIIATTTKTSSSPATLQETERQIMKEIKKCIA